VRTRILISAAVCALILPARSQTADDKVAAGDAFLRGHDLSAAHTAYAQALVEDSAHPDASIMRAVTLLADLFEAPTADLPALLNAFNVSYNHDIYDRDRTGNTRLVSEPYTDTNANDEWDDAEEWDDFNGNGTWDPGEFFWDEDGDFQWDAAEPFTDTNQNGEWDEFLAPDGAPTPNAAIDTIRTQLVARIDEALAHLETASAAAGPEWSRTLTDDMSPRFDSPGDTNDGHTVDSVDLSFAQAGLHLANVALDFLSGYDLDVNYNDFQGVDGNGLKAYWESYTNFFTVRDQSSFTDSQAELLAALNCARDAITALLGKPHGGDGLVASERIPKEDWQDILGYVDDTISSLQAPTEVSIEDYDPVVVHLESLFSDPLDRTDLAPYDFDGNEVDWLAVDPTLNGLFPNEDFPSLYHRIVKLADDDELPLAMDSADRKFVAAGLDAVDAALKLAGGYDFSGDWGTVGTDEFDLDQAFWNAQTDFFTARDPDSFAAAKTSTRSALQNALDGLDLILNNEAPAKTAGPWASMDFGDWTRARNLVAQLLEAVDQNTQINDQDFDPITLNLGKLFDSPIDRAILDAYDFDAPDSGTDAVTWNDVTNPALNDVFPGMDRMAEWYRYHTLNLYDPMALQVVVTDDVRAQKPRFLWNAVWEDWGTYYDPDTGNWQYGPHWAKQNDYLFEDKMQFKIYRGTGGLPNSRAELFVADKWPGEYPVGAPWNYLDSTPLQEDLYYYVKVLFTDGNAGQTELVSPRAYQDTDGDGMPDYWETAHESIPGTGLQAWDDADQDTVTNLEEFEAGTDPTATDSDNDGMSDGFESDHELDPLYDDADEDKDQDGYTNFWEMRYQTSPDDFMSNPALELSVGPVSITTTGEWADAQASLPTDTAGMQTIIPSCFSADGFRVFFVSAADNLHPDADGMRSNIYVRDRETDITSAVNVSSDDRAGTLSNAMMAETFLGASDDGNLVYFLSDSTNLVPGLDGAPGHMFRVYVRDIDAGITALVFEGLDSMSPFIITPDGQFAVFTAMIEDTPQRSSRGWQQVYQYDHEAGVVIEVSVSDSGEPAAHESSLPTPMSDDSVRTDTCISADGRYVFFESSASNIVEDDNNWFADIFVRDTHAGTTRRVNVADDGDGSSWGEGGFIAAGADGRFVLFRSADASLAGDDIAGNPVDFGEGLFLRDTAEERTTFVASGLDWNSAALISRDGKRVAYEKSLDAAFSQIYVFDWTNGTTELATPTVSGDVPSVDCQFAWDMARGTTSDQNTCFSENGRFVFFRSQATDLVENDENGMTSDLFVRDLLHKETRIVSLSDEGEQAWWSSSSFVQASQDGRYVLFGSSEEMAEVPQAWEALSQSPNGHLYLRDLVRNTTAWVWTDDSTGQCLFHPSGNLTALRFGGPSSERVFLRGWLDTDRDGMTDNYEWWIGLDPHDSTDAQGDPDEDGLTNQQEARADTSPFLADTDGDSLPDGWEVQEGVDPLRNDANANPDGDYLTNLEEFPANAKPLAFEDLNFIVLYTGWNMVSVPSNAGRVTVEDVFFDEAIGTVWAWDALQQAYVDASERGPLDPRRGYWAYVTADVVVYFEVEGKTLPKLW
jgi:hypothetical protein